VKGIKEASKVYLLELQLGFHAPHQMNLL